jgi:outer membrane lipoprotein SlyB
VAPSEGDTMNARAHSPLFTVALLSGWLLVAAAAVWSTRAQAQPADAQPPVAAQSEIGSGSATATPESSRRGEARPVFGTVVAIEAGERPRSSSSRPGVGAALGGAIGALIGRQMDDNGGKTTGTVIGGVIGAWAGHEIEKRYGKRESNSTRVTVALEGGGELTLTPSDSADLKDLRIGDRVRVDNQRISRMADASRAAPEPAVARPAQAQAHTVEFRIL